MFLFAMNRCDKPYSEPQCLGLQQPQSIMCSHREGIKNAELKFSLKRVTVGKQSRTLMQGSGENSGFLLQYFLPVFSYIVMNGFFFDFCRT